jgi:hypothetical protein
MAELVREGRTLVFVSHDMKAIEMLCSRAVRLESGRVADDGSARDVIRRYLLRVQTDRFNHGPGGNGVIQGSDLEILHVSILDGRGREVEELKPGDSMTVRIRYRAKRPIAGPMFCVGLSDGGPCFSQAATIVDGDAPDEISGEGYADCTFESLPLRPRVYEVWGGMAGDLGGNLIDWQRLAMFRIVGASFGPGKGAVSTMLSEAPVEIPYRWTHRAAESGPASISEAR